MILVKVPACAPKAISMRRTSDGSNFVHEQSVKFAKVIKIDVRQLVLGCILWKFTVNNTENEIFRLVKF